MENRDIDKKTLSYKLGAALGVLLISGVICIVAVIFVKILSWLWIL